MALGVSIVVPAFDEAGRIDATLRTLTEQLDDAVGGEWEVIVVDDGSADGTAAVAGPYVTGDRVRLLRLPRNRGKGAALAAGFDAARLPHVFFLDADAPVPLNTVARFREVAAGADVVTGTRRAAGAHVRRRQPFTRRVAGRVYLATLRALGLRAGTDPQCGAKLLRRDRLGEVVAATRAEGFAFDVELLVRARRAGLTVVEAPVTWHHVDGSSIRPWHDARRTIAELLALRRTLSRDVRGGAGTP